MKGKLALVTGATSGIGLGIAKKLASLGIKLAYNGRPSQSNEDLKKIFNEEYGIDSFYENADVSDHNQMEKFHINVFTISRY